MKSESSAMLNETSSFGGSYEMAYPTEENRKIELFRFQLYTKVGFGSCSAGINFQLTTIHGYLEAPFSQVLNRIVY